MRNFGPTVIHRVRATDEVAERLSRLITERQMKVGDPLPSEQELSDAFGVSKRVVREALRMLTAQGVIHTAQGKRAVVVESFPAAIEAYFKYLERMDRKSVLELYELREVIEVGAAVLAARRATAKDLDRASRAVDEMALAENDVERYVKADLEFHAAVIEAAQNRFLVTVTTALSGALAVERELGVRNRIRMGAYPHAISEHRAVLKAVEAGDAAAAQSAMLAHMFSSRKDLIQRLAAEMKPRDKMTASSDDVPDARLPGMSRQKGRAARTDLRRSGHTPR